MHQAKITSCDTKTLILASNLFKRPGQDSCLALAAGHNLRRQELSGQGLLIVQGCLLYASCSDRTFLLVVRELLLKLSFHLLRLQQLHYFQLLGQDGKPLTLFSLTHAHAHAHTHINIHSSQKINFLCLTRTHLFTIIHLYR